MDRPVRPRSLFFAAGALLLSALAWGCAADHTGAPFHMYDSPMLEGESATGQPRSRSFDPLESRSDRSGATADASKVRQKSDTDEEVASDAETLAASRRAEPSDDESAKIEPKRSEREPTETPAYEQKHDEASGGSDAEHASHAADYIWSNYRVNEVEFSEKARRSLPTLFRECKEVGKIYHSSTPDVGDIVFFHNTFDRNEDGRNNDWYTFAALVEKTDKDGRITLLGYRDGEVDRFYMNLEDPDTSKSRHGESTNTQLRPRRDDDPPYTQYLAGQLFAGTCSALGDKRELRVIDNWKPGMKLTQ
ncbi:MAG: hypothetical protein ACOCV2_14090 [Persicimonas sp.]